MIDEEEMTVQGTGIQPVVLSTGTELPPIGVTRQEAMILLRVGRTTLQRMIDRGDIKVFTVGPKEATGGLRVNYQSLLEYAEKKQVSPDNRYSRR